MGTFGNEFWNVADRPGYVPDQGVNFTEWLERTCELAHLSDPRGVIVYLPPRDYVIDTFLHARRMVRGADRRFEMAYNTPDLWIRQNVTLWLAPGARLIIHPDMVVRIDGPMRAELTHIFECRGTDSTSQRRGRVLFHSTKIAEVYPEWWGAIPTPDDQLRGLSEAAWDDTDALVDCIRAAHTDRAFPNGNTMPPIPIVLRGKYLIRREIEVSARGTQLPPESERVDRSTIVFPETSGVVNGQGLVLLGRRGVGGANAGFSALVAAGDFSPTFDASGLATMPKGRALLRMDGLHGSIIDGVGFDGFLRAAVCIQITGNNARSTVFRGCAFVKAGRALAQVGDYIILDTDPMAVVTTGIRFRPLHASVNGGHDLSGLRFENCTFESNILIRDVLVESSDPMNIVTPRQVTDRDMERRAASSQAQAVTGIVFHANNTLPMTLDGCFFVGGMAACVAAFGGTLVIRGGGAQNQAIARPRVATAASSMTLQEFEGPRGGVDIFIGDPILREDRSVAAVRGRTAEAGSPTGVTVIQFESQSDQFLDTFSHQSASANRVAFFPTVLQGVSQRSTSPNTIAPPSTTWLGPGIRASDGEALTSRASALTLVGCVFGGRRTMQDTEASGAVVVAANAFLVADVGTRLTFPAPAVFYSRLGTTISETPLTGTMRPVWLRTL